MENAITIAENRPLTKQDIVAQKRLVQEVMKAVMKDGIHYGIIPGCKQPTLYKAGSEAILSTFRIAVDPSVEDLSTHDCYRYRVTLRGIIPSGEIVGAGVGECSTDEEKYKWRGAVCDEEFNETPEDRRRSKWNKGAYGKPAYQVKQVRTNPADLSNTVLKMAKKRAQIDLTLTATGISDIFAQDLEDLPEEVRDEMVREENHQKQGKPSVSSPSERPPADDKRKVSEAQAKMLFAKLKNKGVPLEDFCAHYKIQDLKDLPFAEMNPALKAIDSWKTETATEPSGEEPEKIPCKNCGEMIDPATNAGHIEGCSYAAA